MTNHVQLTLATTAQSMSGGADAVQGIGQDTLFTCGSAYNTLSFNTGDLVTVIFTDQATGFQTQVGAGNVSGTSPTFCFSYLDKMYTLANYTVYMSAITLPTIWNDPNATGNSYVAMADWYGTNQTLLAASVFQGKMALFANNTIQIWDINADPNQWNRSQVLQNTGTVAPLSVQNLGDYDILYLSNTGIRSLRTRETTLNAFVDDLGSPVDTLVTASNGSNSGACAVVEPVSARYWCLVNETVYVLSRFLSNNITAWSTFLPTYQTTIAKVSSTYTVTVGYQYYWLKGADATSLTDGTTTLTASGYIVAASTSMVLTSTGIHVGSLYENTPFVPSLFLTYQGQVWCRDANRFYLYGGSNGTTTDYTQAVVSTTWLDLDTPGTLKKGVGFDSAFSGNWQFSVGMDALGGTLTPVYNGTQATFELGGIPMSQDGYHVKMQAVSLDGNAAKLSSLIFEYNLSNQKEGR